MTVYIGADFMCQTQIGEGRRAVEVPQFDGKCKYFVEHYRYIPDGETWTREDGVEFAGEMLTPTVDYRLLEAVQAMYDEIMSSEDVSRGLITGLETRVDALEAQ